MTDEDPKEGRIRLGRRRKEAVETLDAIEMAEEALEQAEPTMGPPDPAVLLVEEQRRLIKAQVSNERMGFVLRIMTACVGLAFVLGLGWMVWTAHRSTSIVVDPFDSPYGLTRRGHSGQVIARGVADVVSGIAADAGRGASDSRAVTLTWTRDMAVVVPTTGVSLGEIDKLLRTWFGNETHVGGSVTVSPEGLVSLTIRADRVRGRTFTGPESEMPRLIAEASEYIYGQFEPELYSWYLIQSQRYEDAQAFIPTAYAQNPGSRANLAYYWGVLLVTLGQSEEAAEKLRISLESSPNDPGTWDMLIATLFDTEGEEAAYRAGREMMAFEGYDHETMASGNYRLLVQDWAGLIASEEANAETGALGYEIGLADAEGRRYHWLAARKHLTAAPANQPLTQAAAQMVAAYAAFERRDYAAAVEAMTVVDRLSREDEDVAYTFHEGPCFLGLALGLAGREREAEAAFVRGDRYVACAAFRADVLEARGLTAEADRQYGVAIRLAPSLPFAYQRRALALLARGDTARAFTRFRDAHERGPTWADSLKGMGDALAAQGRYEAAVARYEQAIPLAPGWRALHLAHAAALNRLGRRDEAQAALEQAAA
jgi:tetratricopeptide (TPR) repeat protein